MVDLMASPAKISWREAIFLAGRFWRDILTFEVSMYKIVVTKFWRNFGRNFRVWNFRIWNFAYILPGHLLVQSTYAVTILWFPPCIFIRSPSLMFYWALSCSAPLLHISEGLSAVPTIHLCRFIFWNIFRYLLGTIIILFNVFLYLLGSNLVLSQFLMSLWSTHHWSMSATPARSYPLLISPTFVHTQFRFYPLLMPSTIIPFSLQYQLLLLPCQRQTPSPPHLQWLIPQRHILLPLPLSPPPLLITQPQPLY